MQPVPAGPTVLHPMPEHPRVVLLKQLVTSPLIEVGDFTYYETSPTTNSPTPSSPTPAWAAAAKGSSRAYP